jgi:hypothetical protein
MQDLISCVAGTRPRRRPKSAREVPQKITASEVVVNREDSTIRVS